MWPTSKKHKKLTCDCKISAFMLLRFSFTEISNSQTVVSPYSLTSSSVTAMSPLHWGSQACSTPPRGWSSSCLARALLRGSRNKERDGLYSHPIRDFGNMGSRDANVRFARTARRIPYVESPYSAFFRCRCARCACRRLGSCEGCLQDSRQMGLHIRCDRHRRRRCWHGGWHCCQGSWRQNCCA